MKVMVCDDEPLARDRLVRLLNKLPDIEVVGEAYNGVDLLNKIQLTPPDVVVTDIRMPGMDGVEAASHIAQMEEPPAVIFCTAYDQYAIQAFQVQAVGYLLKPVRPEDLGEALEKASRVNKAQLSFVRKETDEHATEAQVRDKQYVSVKNHKGLELIPIADIRYFMADQKYVTVRYLEGEALLDDTLKELETELGTRFVRAHRNALVSCQHIEAIENYENQFQVRLQGIDERVTVSRRHVAALKALLKNV